MLYLIFDDAIVKTTVFDDKGMIQYRTKVK